jgi:hypothetical protein
MLNLIIEAHRPFPKRPKKPKTYGEMGREKGWNGNGLARSEGLAPVPVGVVQEAGAGLYKRK